MGLDCSSFAIFMYSFMSPTSSLYGFPARPCLLRHFSSLLGSNHTHFTTLTPHLTIPTMTIAIPILNASSSSPVIDSITSSIFFRTSEIKTTVNFIYIAKKRDYSDEFGGIVDITEEAYATLSSSGRQDPLFLFILLRLFYVLLERPLLNM